MQAVGRVRHPIRSSRVGIVHFEVSLLQVSCTSSVRNQLDEEDAKDAAHGDGRGKGIILPTAGTGRSDLNLVA